MAALVMFVMAVTVALGTGEIVTNKIACWLGEFHLALAGAAAVSVSGGSCFHYWLVGAAFFVDKGLVYVIGSGSFFHH